VAWYGESYSLYWGGVLAGGAVDFGDWVDHYDGEHHALTAGDDVIVGSYGDPANPSEFAAFTDPITVRWAIEVLSGSGQLRLSAGIDPDFAYTNPALASEALGTVTVSGATTLVTEPFTVSQAQIAAGDTSPIVRIECLSGTVDIAQVKLRVWPAAGAAGAWIPAGEGSTTNNKVQRWNDLVVPDSNETGLLVENVTDYLSYPDPAADEAALAAQTLAIAALASKAGETANFSSVNSAQTGEIAASQNGTGALLYVVFSTPNAYYYTAEAYILSNPGVIRADLNDTVPDVAYVGVDPNEHRFEAEAQVRPVGGGPLVPSFGGWTTAAVNVTYSTSDPTAWAVGPAVLQQHDVDPDFDPPIDPIFGYSQMPYEVYVGGAQTAIPAGGVDDMQVVETVQIEGGQAVLIAVQTPGINSPTVSARGLVDAEFAGDPVHGYGFTVMARADVVDTGHLVTFGPVEVYDPAATPAPETDPRFYVKDLAGVMRPVGFGKPSTETAMFHVPTAQGRYRDLTTAEYATYGPDSRPPGGYPLKVKRRDTAGEPWWDHVAWLVPDEG
jgi:hypothetical protein